MGINKRSELTIEFVSSLFVLSYTPGLFSDPMARQDSFIIVNALMDPHCCYDRDGAL